MQEKWWRNGNLTYKANFDSTNENALTIQSLRRGWEILEGDGVGITVYKTPSGIFRAEETEQGTLVRLERIEIEEAAADPKIEE